MENNQINPKELLENLLSASKVLAERGKNYAEDALNIPEAGIERENKIDGLKKGALASAVLFGLLGTKGGRSVTGKVIKLGGIAALGTAAYKGYQHWRSNNAGDSVHELDEVEAQERALLLISAMVSAANADGKLDDHESALLKHKVLDMKLSQKYLDKISKIADQPLSADELCALVNDDTVASEVYLATRIFIDDESSAIELDYLSNLVKGLGLSDELTKALDAHLD